jgi:hypothetical protein
VCISLEAESGWDNCTRGQKMGRGVGAHLGEGLPVFGRVSGYKF